MHSTPLGTSALIQKTCHCLTLTVNDSNVSEEDGGTLEEAMPIHHIQASISSSAKSKNSGANRTFRSAAR